MAINNDDIKITLEEEEAIKENDPSNIPLDATDQGWTGDQVRAQIAASITANEGSVLSELKNKTEIIANKFDEVDSNLATRDSEIDTLQTDVTNLESEVDTKVTKSGDTMTGALTFENADATRIVMGNNDITTEGQINATTFNNGEQVSDAIKVSDLANLFDVVADEPINPNNWVDSYASAIDSKFNEYTKTEDLDLNYLQTDGENAMSADLDMGGQAITNVGDVDGVDVSSLKTTTDNHIANTTNPHSVTANQVGAYSTSQADTKFMDKSTYVDGNDKILLTKLPDAAKSQTFVLLSTDNRPTGVLEGDKLYETDTGDSYIYDGSQWVLLADADWQNVNLDWVNVDNTPTSISGYGITDAYTEQETDDLLDNKSDVGHTHTESDITDLDKYTQQETDGLLANKSDVGHTHLEVDITDLDKFTQDELLVDGVLDTRYYTETEIDTNIYTKSNVDDLIDNLDSLRETHVVDQTNPHNVTATQTGAYTTSEADANFAPISHNHVEAEITDLDKYTQNEVDTLLNAKADLVNGKVPINQIPLQFNDVLQGYFNDVDAKFYEEDTFVNEINGEDGKLYIDITSNSIYRWEGTSFVAVITIENIAYGTTAGTAYEGNSGQANANAITVLQSDVNNNSNNISANTTDIAINQVDINNIETGTTVVKKAEQDQNGNVIDTTYATKTEVANITIESLDEINDVNAGASASQVLRRNVGNTAWEGSTLTKTDVGLNNVQNYGIATQNEAEGGSVDNKYMTPLKTAQAISVLSPAPDLSVYDAHINNTSNPHGVTAGQVGAALEVHTHSISDVTNLQATLDTKLENSDLSGYATETYVGNAISNLVDTAPTTLDTLNELASALGDDPNFASTVSTNLGNKADKETTINAGSGLIGGGDLSANRTISHADTSSQASVDNSSNKNYIKSIILDTYGHVTGITSDVVETVSVGITAPASPQEGDLWFDSTELTLYVYYDDGTSLQWVGVSEGAIDTQYSAGVVETNASENTQFWTGTQAQYDAIGTKDANTLYFITE